MNEIKFLLVVAALAAVLWGLNQIFKSFVHPKTGKPAIQGVLVQADPVPIGRVLLGTLAAAAMFAVYAVIAAVVLASPPSLLVEWWPVVILVDLAVFAVIVRSCLPPAYGKYLSQKPKGQNAAIDRAVGVILSLVLIPSVGLHILMLAQAPSWTLL